MSESNGSPLARALAKAQGAMAAASKDRVNPHFKSSYATLASVWDACREPLSSNGLAVVQCVTAADKATVTIETRLLHEGGESVVSSLTMPVSQPTAQGIGSAITYARRYALAALVGVAPDDDDDGNEASKPPRREPPPAQVVPIHGEWEARINAAATVAELVAVGKELHQQPKPIRDAVRDLWDRRHKLLGVAEKGGGK